MKDLTIIIRDCGNGEKAIDILYNGYNIIQETIYDNDLTNIILDLINNNRRNNLSNSL